MVRRKTLLTTAERAAWIAYVEAGRTKAKQPTEPKPRRTLLSPPKPASGRIGRDVVVELSKPELHTLAAVIDDLIAAWPQADVALPSVLHGLPRFLRRKVGRRSRGDYVDSFVSVRLPKRTAYAVGGMLLSSVEFMQKGALPAGNGAAWLVRGIVKLILAGTSRPGRRESSQKKVHRSTLYRRKKRAETFTASRILQV